MGQPVKSTQKDGVHTKIAILIRKEGHHQALPQIKFYPPTTLQLIIVEGQGNWAEGQNSHNRDHPSKIETLLPPIRTKT